MKVIFKKNQTVCLSEAMVIQYFFDQPWTLVRISALKAFGQLNYYHNFPRPMFEVKCPDGTLIKGVESSSECRVIFPRKRTEGAIEKFEAFLQEIGEN